MRIQVDGEPIAEKSGKRTPALKKWKDRVRDTCGDRRLPGGHYRVRMDFALPPDRYQVADRQNPHGKDLDNLVVPVFDALSRSVLRDAGGDGAIVELFATKRPAVGSEVAGVRITITLRRAVPTPSG